MKTQSTYIYGKSSIGKANVFPSFETVIGTLEATGSKFTS